MSNQARAIELMNDRLKEINPKTWVEDTPLGLAAHLGMDLQDAGLLTPDPKPEPPVKQGDCGGRYWHDEHLFAMRTPKGTVKQRCKGRS